MAEPRRRKVTTSDLKSAFLAEGNSVRVKDKQNIPSASQFGVGPFMVVKREHRRVYFEGPGKISFSLTLFQALKCLEPCLLKIANFS